METHGNLKSHSCLITSRWVLKLYAFGLNSLCNDEQSHVVSEYEQFRELFWTAPELLTSNDKRGTAKGDVYSFGIILQEILYRSMPYNLNGVTPKGTPCW